jgi:DNA (cytosine-5)-methyltransferase 1
MILIGQDKREFAKGKEGLYRRLSVRECARIQTFPDTFAFYYKSVVAGYKMIGNAVPVTMGYVLAKGILKDLNDPKILRNQSEPKIDTEVNGHSVRERMVEIINSIPVNG